MNIVPRVAAIHDISGFGRCSLTVITPVLSAMRIQVCPVPTAVLSTHSGGFGKFSFHDLTDTMDEYSAHWKDLGLRFDCLYSGFLGSEKQIDIVSRFFDDFRLDGQIVVVDPVMGDNGRLYKTYTAEMQSKMRLLVDKADVITPNLTEAYFLLREQYSDAALSTCNMKHLLKGLSDMGPDTVVVTGVKDQHGHFCNVAYKRSQDAYWRVDYDRVPVHYPGTGDVFAGVLVGGLVTGDSLPIAMDRATQFVSLAVRVTYGYRAPEREGVMLEKVLPALYAELQHSTYSSLE